jgi:hypothetical protein
MLTYWCMLRFSRLLFAQNALKSDLSPRFINCGE